VDKPPTGQFSMVVETPFLPLSPFTARPADRVPIPIALFLSVALPFRSPPVS
jgi:hypothetical protein